MEAMPMMINITISMNTNNENNEYTLIEPIIRKIIITRIIKRKTEKKRMMRLITMIYQYQERTQQQQYKN